MAAVGPSDWTRLRAVSESLKSEVYVSLAGAGRYRTAPSEAEARLRQRLIELELQASGLARHLHGVEPVARDLPPVRGFDDYVDARVIQQVEGYYRPQSLMMRSRTTLLRRLEVTLALAGTLQGALAGGFGIAQLGVWIAVVTTVGTAVTAHAAAGRYAYQEIEYSRTAQELQALRLAGPSSASDIAEQDRFIARCEDVISVQNDAWMVKWAGA
ncbi:SLATT domain-containing protein [Streptomyces sp. R28]|uniref:SLATT domain-containing protein n=1 Tax=Streptomyces sp. R28 TaxID=3238628 RepID=A0AB39Q8M2_9ACTN